VGNDFHKYSLCVNDTDHVSYVASLVPSPANGEV
jgi:hypothetical protein